MRKKFLQGVTSLGIASAICLACGVVTASAATLDTSKVKIDYENQKIIVSVKDEAATPAPEAEDNTEPSTPATPNTKDKEIVFGVSALKKGAVTTSSWEVYDVKGDTVEIDISSLNTQKDNYVQIKGDVSSDPLTLLIPKTDKTFKLKFDAINAYVSCSKGEDKKADLQYRTQYGNWTAYGKADEKTNVDLSIYQQRGATLYFRLAGVKEQAVNEVTPKDDIYTMKALPGKEIKVAVGKKANGPKATADYIKRTVTIPAGSKYRIIDPTAETLPADWTDSASKTTLADATFPTALYNGGSVEVKKAAAGKKAESKIFQLAFPNKKEDLTATAPTGTGIEGVTVSAPSEDKTVTFKMAKKGSGKKEKDVIEVKNDTSSQYQIYLGDTVPADGKGVKTVKAGKTLTIDAVDKSAVQVRKSGDKKNAIWSTDYITIGNVALPEGGGGTTAQTPEEIKADLQNVVDAFIADSASISRGDWASGMTVDLAKSGKTVTWGSSAEYTLDDASKVSGVTITVAIKSQSCSDGHFAVNNNVVEVVSKPCNNDTVTVTVTASKGGQSVEKEVVGTAS